MIPEFGKNSFSRAKSARDLTSLSEDMKQLLKSPTMRLIEEALLDQSTRQLSSRGVSISQLEQALSLHLSDTTVDEISLALLSGYILGHEQPFDTLCTLLLHIAQPLVHRTPPPAFSQVDWFTSLIEKLMQPSGSSMEQAKGYLTLLQQEIAPQNTKEDHDCKLFSECDAFFAKLAPLLPNKAIEQATVVFARWLMAKKHSNEEIAAAYSLISCFFSRLQLYDVLIHLLPCCSLENRELGLLLTSLWSKQAIDNATGVLILQTFDKLLAELERNAKIAPFKRALLVFYNHISQIPLIKKQNCLQSQCNLQIIRDFTNSIARRLA